MQSFVNNLLNVVCLVVLLSLLNSTDAIAQNDPKNVRFEINGNGFTNSAWLSFSPDGSFTEIVRGDAVEFPSFNSTFVQLATAKEDSSKLLDINHLPDTTNRAATIPLDITYNVDSTATNDFTLTVTQINLSDSIQIIFNDNIEGKSITLTDTFTYTIPISNGGTQSKLISDNKGKGQQTPALTSLRNPDYSLSILPVDIAKPEEVIIYGSAGWRLLSIPKSNASLQDVIDNTAIQGITGGSNTDDEPNVFTYDDSGQFEQPASVQTTISNGYGLGIFFFDNALEGSSRLPLTLQVDGNPPAADVDVVLNTLNTPETSAGSGGASSFFTLVGNPFASNFNLNSLIPNANSIQDHVHIWDAETQSYLTKDRTQPFIISPWQAFWVERSSASKAASIRFPVSGKTEVSETEIIFKQPERVEQKADITFSLRSDQTVDNSLKLAFRTYATVSYDRADAAKLSPLNNKYAIAAFRNGSTGTLKSVESLPFELDRTIRRNLVLAFKNTTGEYRLDWNGLAAVSRDLEFELYDSITDTKINLRTTSNYTFNHKKTTTGTEFESESETKAKAKAASNRALNPQLIADTGNKSNVFDRRFQLIITPRTSTNIDGDDAERPNSLRLHQNYPNPFNPATTIQFELPARNHVLLRVYNINGQMVAQLLDGVLPAGPQQVTFDAGGLSSGVYMYQLETDNITLTKKMILIK